MVSDGAECRLGGVGNGRGEADEMLGRARCACSDAGTGGTGGTPSSSPGSIRRWKSECSSRAARAGGDEVRECELTLVVGECVRVLDFDDAG